MTIPFIISATPNYISAPQYSSNLSNTIYVANTGFSTGGSVTLGTSTVSVASGYTGTWGGSISFASTSFSIPDYTAFSVNPLSSTANVLYYLNLYATAGAFSSGVAITIFVTSSPQYTLGLSLTYSSSPMNAISLNRGQTSPTYQMLVYPRNVSVYPNAVSFSTETVDIVSHFSVSFSPSSFVANSLNTTTSVGTVALQAYVDSSAPLIQTTGLFDALDTTTKQLIQSRFVLNVFPNSAISTADGPETLEGQNYTNSLIPYIESGKTISDYSLGKSTAYWKNLYVNSITATSLTIAGGVTNTSISYTVIATDSIIVADATSATLTITLPSAGATLGRKLLITKADSSTNQVKVTASNNNNIEGVGTKTISSQYSKVGVVSVNTSTWFDLGTGGGI